MKFHAPPFQLSEIKIEVTHRCPLACVHCSSDAGPSCLREMDIADCLRVISQAADAGVKEVAISGGEPLIWPHVIEAAELAAQKGLQVTVYTSGNVPNVRKLLGSLKGVGATKAVFSVFGADESTHERITRIKGSFNLTLAGLTAARDVGLTVEIHFVPMADNFGQLEAIAELAKKNGCCRVSVLRFVPQGRGYLMRKYALSAVQNCQLKHTIENLRRNGIEIRTGSPYNFLLLNPVPKCTAGIDRLIVGPNLRVYPCDAFKQIEVEEIVGADDYSCLATKDLNGCWTRSAYLNAVRDYLTTPFHKPCETCGDLEQCLSGCLAQKVLAHGDLKKRPDPMCLRRKEVEQ